MHPRLYRLVETYQRIDHALRREQRSDRLDWRQIIRLKRLKLRVKQLIERLISKPIRI
jgi:hypothetical protein